MKLYHHKPIIGKNQKLEEARKDSPLEFSEGAQICLHLDIKLWVSRYVIPTFCFKPLFVITFYRSPRKQYNTIPVLSCIKSPIHGSCFYTFKFVSLVYVYTSKIIPCYLILAFNKSCYLIK